MLSRKKPFQFNKKIIFGSVFALKIWEEIVKDGKNGSVVVFAPASEEIT